MDLVDDTAVDVADELVTVRLVLAGCGVDFLGGHHQHVRPRGQPGVEVALAGDDVHRVAEFLESLPLAFFLVRERA